jgi:uncharacterized protein YdeI (YjbR/CyaY-like superfamily)
MAAVARRESRQGGGRSLARVQQKDAGKPTLDYEDSVEEALCFGWIDSLIKRIDDERYCRKFMPRKSDSQWSNTNKRRVTKIIKEGRMTKSGLVKVEAAKKSGVWDLDPRPLIPMALPEEFSRALARDRAARDFFGTLAPTYRKQFIGWIVSAKAVETRARRIRLSLELLGRGQKLGLK